ncbi:ABC transporter permease [Teredinibacter waterburyi]|uniref:ABC transporter permease n=1 Tax=Teredinibacter waterburyi TaxID=1500538 RepID=UPI00165F9F09|nr:FtsX-like permease family protein [Teredinibacter waterburyi]
MKNLLTFIWRDWRGGELSILVFSVILATATVTSISLFTNRIQNSIQQEAAEFLAADVQVRSSMNIPDEWFEDANELNLQSAQIQSFRAMAFAKDAMQLATVKAVSNSYPLKGTLTIAENPADEGQIVSNGPAAGEAWIVARLMAALDIKTGDTVTIGDADLTVTSVLIKEPDSPQTFFGVAPRIMIHQSDVPRTGAVQVGSRVNYALLLAGENKQLDAFKTLHQDDFGNHFRWTTPQQGSQSLDQALQRAEKFLLLAGSLSVILCGVAIALAARRYATRQTTNVALLKTFGQSPNQIAKRYLAVLFVVASITLSLGFLSGWGLHILLLTLLADLLPANLAAANYSAYGVGALAGSVALFSFALPPLLALRKVPPAKVLREDSEDALISARLSAVIGFFSILLLVAIFSRDLAITAIVTVGCLVTIFGVGFLGWLTLQLGNLVASSLGQSWRLGLANLQRHQQVNALQIMIFASLFMLLFVLIASRTSLIGQWQSQLPTHSPNVFVFNIFNHEKAQIEEQLVANKIDHQPFYPMMRGRVIEVNGESITPRIEQTASHMNYERELNLTWAKNLGDDNKVTDGHWHDAESESLEVSAEADYAQGLGLVVGDKLTFSITAQEFTATLTSIRSVQWDSMNPNFFMIFNQPVLDDAATNWLTSFYLPPDKKAVLNQLTAAFPTISLIELDQMIAQIQGIISQVSMAIEFILLLVLAAGTLVLITSIQSTLDIRMQESAILRALGAPKRLVIRTLLVEFGCLGGMAGLLGAIAAEAALYGLQTRVFSLDYAPNSMLILIGPIMGALLVGMVGWLSTRSVVATPPLQVLRQLS